MTAPNLMFQKPTQNPWVSKHICNDYYFPEPCFDRTDVLYQRPLCNQFHLTCNKEMRDIFQLQARIVSF